MKIKNQGDYQSFSQLYNGDLLAQYFYINELVNDFCVNKTRYTDIEVSDLYANVQDWWNDVMDKKFAPALCVVGKLHEFGIGTIVDRNRAMECYKTAAQMYIDNNNPHPVEALRYLALIMETTGDHATAVRLFSLGAPVDGECCFFLGKIMYESTTNSGYRVNSMNKTQRETLAISVLQDGCNKDNADCMELLCKFYQNGLCGLPQDLNQALYYAEIRLETLQRLANTATGIAQEKYQKQARNAEILVNQLKSESGKSTNNFQSQSSSYTTTQKEQPKKSNINWVVAIILLLIWWPAGLIYILIKNKKK